MTETILDLLPFGAAATSLAGCVWLFLLLKAELRKNRRRSDRDRQALDATCARLRVDFDELRRQTDDAASGHWEAVVPRPRPSLNYTHRAQVLRMSRRGERPEQIAAALAVPQAEVDLLLKIHQATVAAAS